MYNFQRSDDLKGITNKMTTDKGILPISLQSASCPVFNSPSVDHFTEIVSYKEDIDGSITLVPSASIYSNSNANPGTTGIPSSTGTTIIIVVVVVVIILAGGGYYYMTMKPKNYELTAGRFEIGE